MDTLHAIERGLELWLLNRLEMYKEELLSRPLASTPYLTSYALAWPGLTRVTESKGMPKSRTFLSKPCNAA